MNQTAVTQRKRWTIALALILFYSPIAAPAQVVIRGGRLDDVEVRQKIVQESVAAYLATGQSCPCPYNSARDGSSCGERSAHSRPGGASPLCFPSDVSDEIVSEYRRTGQDRN
jgi:hypothetical protein